jgi:dynein heavy chain
MRLGDAVIPVHDDFRFYMTTKLPNPHFSPETSANVTIINFTLAPTGLEDQLLALVVAHERPDLEEAKNTLMVSNAAMKKELSDLEDKVLFLLSSVQGNPVDDERLIDTLAASKKTSEEIQTKMIVVEKTEQDIDQTRNQYVPVSIRTRILFFCITELSNIDPMYQYSLSWFMGIFVSAIQNSEKSDNVVDRVKSLNEYFTFSLYCNVCRSLFEKHKLLFAFLLVVKILMNDNLIDLEDWKFLLGGRMNEKKTPNPAPGWLSSRIWSEILTLSSLDSFRGIEEDFQIYIENFKTIFDCATPETLPLPGNWEVRISKFQKLLLLKCLRPDRMTSAIQDFISFSIGSKFVEPQSGELSVVFKESNPFTPIIFVLSSGADPANALYKFAEEMRFSKKLNAVSLGRKKFF